MNQASRTRANITGTIFGVLFGIANFVPALIGSVPGCGCCLNYFVWVAGLFCGGFAGLFAAVFADWVKVPYERGLAVGGQLGLRAGALAGLFGGLVFQAVPTITQMIAFMFPGANDVSVESAQSGAMGAVIATAIGTFVNLAVVPLCSGLCGAFWGFVVGAIRRRQEARADEVAASAGRFGYFAIAYGGSWAIMTVLGIAYGVIVATRPGGGIAESGPSVVAPPSDMSGDGDAPDEEPGAPAEMLGTDRSAAPVGSTGGSGTGPELAEPTEPWLDAPCTPTSLSASRWLDTGHRGEDYRPEQAFDGTNDTAWAVRDPQLGADWIEATFAPGTRISRVVVATGYDKYTRRGLDLFTANAHLSRFTIDTEVGHRSVDVANEQRSAEVALHVATGRVRLIVDEAWPGDQWQDLAISEITIYCGR